jgi:hypothetical protein
LANRPVELLTIRQLYVPQLVRTHRVDPPASEHLGEAWREVLERERVRLPFEALDDAPVPVLLEPCLERPSALRVPSFVPRFFASVSGFADIDWIAFVCSADPGDGVARQTPPPGV